MSSSTRRETSGVPDEIQRAEEWRVLGEKLRTLAPDEYERVFAMLVSALIGLSDGVSKNIPESYFVT
jgi:hypothetical protein